MVASANSRHHRINAENPRISKIGSDMRKRLYEIIEVAREDDRVSFFYDAFMLVAILVSIIPLAFKGNDAPDFRQNYPFFFYSDVVTALIFTVDYILRFITADYKLKKRSVFSFLRYPFTLWAIVDLVSILPSVPFLLPSAVQLNSSFKLFRLFRTIRSFRIFRVAKVLRYSRSFSIIVEVIKNSADALLAVCMLAIGYILISALIIFNVEQGSAGTSDAQPQNTLVQETQTEDTWTKNWTDSPAQEKELETQNEDAGKKNESNFNNFLDAVYWATVTLTTVGYGDVCAGTMIGKIITIISSFFGIAIVALPAGIITAGYMKALTDSKKDKEDEP